MPKILSPAAIDDFRERLIDTAERLFAAHGPAAVSLRQLAAEMGVSPMTSYRYFKDKDEILAAVRARGFDRFAEALEAAFARPGDAIERSFAVGFAYIRFAFEHTAVYRLMFDLTQPCERDYPDLVRANNRARATMTAHIEALIAAGFAQGEPALLAHAFWAALHGLIVLKLADKLGEGVDFDEVLDTLTRILGQGVRPQPASA